MTYHEWLAAWPADDVLSLFTKGEAEAAQHAAWDAGAAAERERILAIVEQVGDAIGVRGPEFVAEVRRQLEEPRDTA